MPWNPDIDPSLSSPGVNIADGVENSMWLVWHEFLDGWFAGVSRKIDSDGATKVFPAATIGFQQSVIPPKLDGLHINLTLVKRQSSNRKRIGGAMRFDDTVDIRIWFRARQSSKSQDTPDHLVAFAADMLFLVLNNSDFQIPLAEKGILNPRCRYPVMSGDPDYSIRSIEVKCRLWYPSTAQTL